MAGLSPRTVADDLGLPLGDVSNWAFEAREMRRKAAAP